MGKYGQFGAIGMGGGLRSVPAPGPRPETRPGMIGRRRFPDENGVLRLGEGDYGRALDGFWIARPPGCQAIKLDGNSVVAEHEDGTISVATDLFQGDWRELTKGVWIKL